MAKKLVEATALVRLSKDGEFIEAGESVKLSRSQFRRLVAVGAVEGEIEDLGEEEDGSISGSRNSDNRASPRIFGGK